MMFRSKAHWIAAMTMIFFAGCSPVEKSNLPDSSGSTTETSTAPDTANSPLYFYVMAKPEGASATAYSTVGSCIIPAGTAAGSSGATMNCSISMHEGTMYFSDIKFVAGTTDAAYCNDIVFQPFYYYKSNAAGFTDAGTTTAIDCSASPLLIGCLGGAGPLLLPTIFPTSTATYFLASNTLESSWAMDSQNKQRIAHTTDYSFIASNSNLTNDLTNRAASISYSGAHPVNYAGSGLYQDYKVTCRDTYAETMYSITLTLSSVHGTTTQFFDWQ